MVKRHYHLTINKFLESYVLRYLLRKDVKMDLSKAYDCLPHDLMVAKLEAHGISKESLQLTSDYLSYRKQRTKIGSAYSDWANVISEIPQRSILGPLLFNIFINDIFLVIEK